MLEAVRTTCVHGHTSWPLGACGLIAPACVLSCGVPFVLFRVALCYFHTPSLSHGVRVLCFGGRRFLVASTPCCLVVCYSFMCWGAHKSLAPTACTLLTVLGHATLELAVVAGLVFVVFCESAMISDLAKQRRKSSWGISEVGKTAQPPYCHVDNSTCAELDRLGLTALRATGDIEPYCSTTNRHSYRQLHLLRTITLRTPGA